MKIKHTALLLAFVLACGTITTSCSSSDNTVQEDTLTSREVDFSNIGLKYTTPESWQEYTKSNNIYPYSYEDDYSLENIRYNYITPEDWKTIAKSSTGGENISLDDYLYPICEIVIAQTENESQLYNSGLYKMFSKRKLVAENNGIGYYLFYDYVGSTRAMGDENIDIYDKICEGVTELSDSFVITDFDTDSYIESKYAEKNTVTFSSETMDGESMDSSIFKDYDLTLVFIWATYLHPDADNLADLQQAYEHAQELGNVNVIGVCIDTPLAKLDNSEETQKNVETAKFLLEDSGTKFPMLRLDTNLADFVKSKFESIPSFVMVDKNGVVRGGYHTGLYTGDRYCEFIDAMVEKYVTNPDENAAVDETVDVPSSSETTQQ